MVDSSQIPYAIAIDFDGILCQNAYPDIGDPNWDTIHQALKEQSNGAKLILWTCREGRSLERAVAACAGWGLTFDAVNENLPEWRKAYRTDPRKVKGRIQMTLLDMVRDYQSLLERKEELADEVKANNALIEEAKANISQQMIDDDCPSISLGGFKFTLTPKTIYSKKSEAELASEGINFFETLREEGLGDIIVESVNTRTLQSTIKAYVEENDGLSEDLAKCISIFDTYDITRRRESSRATKGGKK